MDSTRNGIPVASAVVDCRIRLDGGDGKEAFIIIQRLSGSWRGKQEMRKMLSCWVYGFSNTDH